MTTSILKRILPGAIVHYKNSPATVIDIINSRQLVIDTNEGKREAVKVSDLVLHQSEDDPLPVDLAKIGEAAWQEAIQSFELIRPLIEMGKGGRSRADVDAVARKAGKHCATIYRWKTMKEQDWFPPCCGRRETIVESTGSIVKLRLFSARQ